MADAPLACDIRLNTTLTDEERAIYQDPEQIQALLARAKTIAVIGLSTEPTKASNMVASYLRDEGYRIVPVHPKAPEILGETAYPTLADIPFDVDLVDVFRPPHEQEAIVAQAIEKGVPAIWFQLRLINLEAAAQARAAGLVTVVDKCLKMEHGRYSGRLHWAGMNTEIISARRRRLI